MVKGGIIMALIPEHILKEIRLTYPYMEKICGNCIWNLPWSEADDENEWCRYYDKKINPQLPACDYYVNLNVRYLL